MCFFFGYVQISLYAIFTKRIPYLMRVMGKKCFQREIEFSLAYFCAAADNAGGGDFACIRSFEILTFR